MEKKSYKIFLWVVVLAALGWLLAMYFMNAFYFKVESTDASFWKEVLDWGYQLVKAILIAGVIGFVVQKFISSIIHPEEDILGKHNIETLYSRRSEATEDLKVEVDNPANNEIFLIGISLRDFLSGFGELGGIWNSIKERLKDPHDSLKVKILLLHPKSLVGHIRFDVEEKKFKRNDLTSDIPKSVSQLKNAFHHINTVRDCQDNLEARFYSDCTFAFAIIFNSSLYIEQYSYRNHNLDLTFPLIKYNNKSAAYKQFKNSFSIQWDNSETTTIENFGDVGTYPAIVKSSLKNIYSGDDESRKKLGEKQIKIINNQDSGTINILAFTGKFYMRFRNYHAIREFSKRENCKINFLLIDPVSEQAILRSVADNSNIEKINSNLNNWTWDNHKSSSLFQDSENIRGKVRKLKDEGFNVDLRYTNAPITSALFISDSEIFVEQYLFGRSTRFPEVVLGGEYPVFEFNVKGADNKVSEEVNILRSSFDVLWNNYSQDLRTNNIDLQESVFNQNLKKLRKYYSAIERKNKNGAESRSPIILSDVNEN